MGGKRNTRAVRNCVQFVPAATTTSGRGGGGGGENARVGPRKNCRYPKTSTTIQLSIGWEAISQTSVRPTRFVIPRRKTPPGRHAVFYKTAGSSINRARRAKHNILLSASRAAPPPPPHRRIPCPARREESSPIHPENSSILFLLSLIFWGLPPPPPPASRDLSADGHGGPREQIATYKRSLLHRPCTYTRS